MSGSNLFSFTRALVDIESITGNEKQAGNYLFEHIQAIAESTAGTVERMDVEPDRFNVLAMWDTPVVTLSTHFDTVPPFFSSSEDDTWIRGRGACDTKGIIACMVECVRSLLAEGIRNLGLLFVVGEERNSVGAYMAGKQNRGSRFLINGEPTENKLALGSKGALRYHLQASGRMAHSAYPELGESAIDKLVDALVRLRQVELPNDELLGPSTLNVGTISGGRAPNVIPDEASAELFFRLVDDGDSTRAAVAQAVNGLIEADEVLCIPAVHLKALPGFPTTVVSYTTDIPAFAGNWGRPLLAGPGTIHVAHTNEERIAKSEMIEAVSLYTRLVKQLLAEAGIETNK